MIERHIITEGNQIGSLVPFFFFVSLSPFFYICSHNNHGHMKTSPKTSLKEYIAPSLRIIPMSLENAICDSTIPGGNEDIGYEDWD